MFKKFQNIIFTMIFIALIVGPMLSWGIISLISNDENKLIETLDFDLNEKRNKATISEPIDISTITYEVDNYYNDRLPYRSVLISTKRYLDVKLEEPYKDSIEKKLLSIFYKRDVSNVAVAQADEVDGKIIKYMDEAVDVYLNHGLKPDEIDPYDSTVDYPIRYLNNPKVIDGQSNWLYLNETNIPYYLGTNKIASDSVIEKHIEWYEILKKKCDQLGKKFVILICPEKEEIYPEYMPTMEIVEDTERPIYIKDYIDRKTNITYIYPKEELLKAKKKYLVYKKYDSHWNSVGAYIAGNMIKEALGIKTIPLRDLKLEKTRTLDADLAFYGNTSVDSLPETFKYVFTDYKPNNEVEIIFTKNPMTMDSFTSHCPQGADHKVFLIGDSFREQLVEFFKKDFKEFYCNTFVNSADSFIIEEIKRADDIVITLVERNEDLVLPELCKLVYSALLEYENEVGEIARKNSN